MYAIVDIETTGSFPGSNGITEIAIVLHNGSEIEGRFETLVNPRVQIPKYVSFLTGITNQMVAEAPPFEDVATNIFRLLNNRIFIAHNVNFDYSFIKHHLRGAGYDWTTKKLCTLKLARKAFPGLHKYGLGHICRTLEIPVENRHRAGGDANATTILFEKILEKGGDKLIKDFLKKENREQILPPNLSSEQVNCLPYAPGVYYFHDAKGKVIYVGKAKSIKKRVVSHFTGLNTSKKRQDFLRNIHSLSFKECATELTASIFESVEIKRLWPVYNVSQKNFERVYGIYTFEDSRGYYRIAIDTKKKYFEPVASFSLLSDAHRALWKIATKHALHPELCFLVKQNNAINYPEVQTHNNRVQLALQELKENFSSFIIIEKAAFENKHSCILVENGKFFGMGLLPQNMQLTETKKIKPLLTKYPENEILKSLIRNYAQKFPEAVITLNN